MLFSKTFSKHGKNPHTSASEEVYLKLCLKEHLSKQAEILIGVWVQASTR